MPLTFHNILVSEFALCSPTPGTVPGHSTPRPLRVMTGKNKTQVFYLLLLTDPLDSMFPFLC